MSSQAMSTSTSTSTSTFDKSEKGSQQKQQIMIPPIKYDLKKATGAEVLNHLHQLMANAALPQSEILSAFMHKLNYRNQTNQPTIVGYIPAPPHADITRQVIGTQGHFFKMTTTLCGVDFIWHDHVNQLFLFWGATTFKVVKALNSIRWRIHKVYTIMAQQQQQKVSPTYEVIDISEDEAEAEDEDEEDYSDLPDLISYEEIQLREKMKAMELDEHGFDINEND